MRALCRPLAATRHPLGVCHRRSAKLALFVGLVLIDLPGRLAARAGAPEPPRPLSPRGIENLAALTRLLGYVRFFHPSDQAAGADWNQIALGGVRAAELAADAAALARALTEIFRPVAPTLQVFVAGDHPARPPDLMPRDGAGPPRILMWRHFGVGLEGPRTGSADHPNDQGANASAHSRKKGPVRRSGVYAWASERIDDQTPFGYGTMAQSVSAAPFRGRRVRLEAQVRAEVAAGGRAQLFLRVDRPGGRRGFFDNMADRPISRPVWAGYALEGDVASDAQSVVIGLVLAGAGRVFIDDVALRAVGGPAGANALANPGFEEGEAGYKPPGWTVPYQSLRDGYRLIRVLGDPCRRGGCAELAAGPAATPPFPRPTETLDVELGGGVAARVPLAVSADRQGSLPHPAGPPVSTGGFERRGAEPGGDDRTVRLAGVALLWPVLHHFHPYRDAVAADFDRALPRALAEAAEDADAAAFERTLERLVAVLPDGNAGVKWQGHAVTHQLPFRWDLVEGRLTIAWVAAGGEQLRAGDVVSEIDGVPAAALVAEMEGRTAAATPEARRTRALDRLAAGAEGESLKLSVVRGGHQALVVARRIVPLGMLDDERREAIVETRPGVFYLDLRRLDDARLEAAMPRLASAGGLVFDLRGRTDASTLILSHLAGREARSSTWQVPVTTRPDHRQVDYIETFWTILPREPRLRARIAFLADSRSQGYPETLLAVVEHYRWGEIVGTRTAASNGDRNWLALPGGYEVEWQQGKTLKHDGSPFQGVGVAPTVPVSPSPSAIAQGRDEVLEKALEVVGLGGGKR